jgi:TPR repeat protein
MKYKLIIMFAVLLCAIVNASAQDASFFRKYADKGDVEAMYNLANCYINGTGGVNQDYSLATMWLTKAAKKKYAPAQVSLAYHYIYGIGVLKDYKQAYELASKAMKQNKASAYYLMGLMYKDGLYVSKSVVTYWQMLNAAADRGDASGQSDLGYYYLYGLSDNNISPDVNKALVYLQKADVQGDAQAKRLLGICYQVGVGVDANIR